jgi:glycosyltransferase involved in cell wall biosynthesis
VRSPEVSLVMAAWQPRPDWLGAAVESALGQVGCTFELVVVDDGSSPPVDVLLGDVDDDRLRVIATEHMGVAHARNVGTRAAGGDFVRYLDSDDVLDAGSTARLLALARPGSIAYGTTVVCDEELRPSGRIECALEGDLSVPCLLGQFDVRLSWLFPRDVLELAGEWDAEFRVCEDWDFVLRALELAPARSDPAAALYYRRHQASLTRTAGVAEAERAARRVVRRYFERHPERRGTRLERRAIAAVDIDKALGYAYMRNRRRSLSRISYAALRDPLAMLRSAPLLLRALARGNR